MCSALLVLSSLLIAAPASAPPASAAPAAAGPALEMVPQVGHQDAPSKLSFNADGKRLLSSSGSGVSKLWDIETGRLLRTFKTSFGAETLLLPDGLRAVVIDIEGTAALWDALHGTLLRKLDAGCAKYPEQITASADGTLAAFGCEHSAYVYELATGKVVRKAPSERGSTAISPDGRAISTRVKVGEKYRLRLIEIATGATRCEVEETQADPPPDPFPTMVGMLDEQVAFGAAGVTIPVLEVKTILPEPGKKTAYGTPAQPTYKMRYRVRVADASTCALGPSLDLADISTVEPLVGRDGTMAVLRPRSERFVQLWDLVARHDVVRIPVVHGMQVAGQEGSAFSPDHKLLAISLNRQLALVDATSGRILKMLGAQAAEVDQAQFSRDGSAVITKAGLKTEAWDLASGRSVGRTALDDTQIQARVQLGPHDTVVQFPAKGGVRILDALSGTERFTLPLRTPARAAVLAETGASDDDHVLDGQYLTADFSGDGATVAISYRNESIPNSKPARSMPGGLLLFDSVAGTPLGDIKGEPDEGYISGAGVSPDRTHVVVFGVKGTRLVALDGQSAPVPLAAVPSLFSADGKLMAGAENKQRSVTVWDASNGRAVTTLSVGTDDIYGLLFLDGAIAVGSKDHNLRIYELPSGKLRTTLHSDKKIAPEQLVDGGKTLVTSSGDGELRSWNLKSGKPLRTAHLPDGKLPGDGKLLLATVPGGVAVYEVATSKLLFTRTSSADGEWLAFAPSGQFDLSSPAARDLVGWRVGDEVLGADQFYEAAYTPGLIAAAVAGKLPKLEVQIELPPSVRMLAPVSAEVGAELEIVVEAEERGGGIGEARLYHQGRLVGHGGARGIQLKAQEATVQREGNHQRFTFKLALMEGANALRAVVFSRSGVESAPAEAVVTGAGAAQPKASLWALAVGINDYEVEDYRLRVSSLDAKSLADLLEQLAPPLFANVSVKRLLDRDATRAGILGGLAWLAQSAKPQDVVVIFLSGHGETDPDSGRYSFLPSDFRFKDLDSLARLGVSQQALSEAMAGIQARKLLVLLDTCKSGQAAKALGATLALRGMGEQRALAVLARASGVAIAAASTDRQSALEDTGLGHGIFTYILLEALQAKGPPVTVAKLLSEVEAQVPKLSEEKYHHLQDPIVARSGQDFPLVVPR